MSRPLYRSEEWIKLFFPEYYVNGERIVLYTGLWPFSGIKETKETSPWRWMPNILDGQTPNHLGELRIPDEKKGYGYITTKVLDNDEFQRWCDNFNYFRNGQRGINPHLLFGGRKVFRKAYKCPQGMYHEGGKDSVATFIFNDGKIIQGI